MMCDLSEKVKQLEKQSQILRSNSDKFRNAYLEMRHKYDEKIKDIEQYSKNMSISAKNRNKAEESLENELRNEKNKSKYFENKTNLLIKEKKEMTDKMNAIINNRDTKIVRIERESVDLSKRCLELKNSLDLLIASNIKLSKDYERGLTQMKKRFEAQNVSLNKQKQYYQDCNQTNKRKQLSAQYVSAGLQKIYVKNQKELTKSIGDNSDEIMAQLGSDISDLLKKRSKNLKVGNKRLVSQFVRENNVKTQELKKSAKRITEDRDKVACPVCDRRFEDVSSWRKHLISQHLTRCDS